MTVNTEQMEILARLRKQSAGSYERVKETEAKPGGRSLPGNMKNAVGRATELKFGTTEKKGDPYAFLYMTCVEPVEHAGVFAGVMFSLWDSEFRSYDEEFENFIGALKLMGYKDMIESASETEFFTKVLPKIMEDVKENKPYVYFNTSRRAGKDGAFRVFISGEVEAGYSPPEQPGEKNEHEDKGYKGKSAPKAPASKSPAKEGPKTKAPAKAPGKSPGKAPEAPKSKAPPKAPPGPKCPVALDDEAMTVGDPWKNGETYYGKIIRIDTKARTVSLYIQGADPEVYLIPWANIAPSDGQGSSGESGDEGGFLVGQRVQSHPDYFDDGTSYPATVTEVNGDNLTLEFEDGQVLEMPMDQVLALDA